MKVTFKEYILEYYKGRNATIGFRYSKPNLQSNIKLLVFSKSSELENIISNRLDELLDKHYLDISIISNNNVIDHILNNIPTELINIIIEEKLDLYEVSIELTTYDEDEILSFIFELSKSDDYIISPLVLLNDEPFDINKKHRTKSKIGFKK